VNTIIELRKNRLVALVTAGLVACAPSYAQQAQPAPAADKPADATADKSAEAGSEDATALAKKLQNPIGDLYNIPFQSNTNFNVGPHKGTQEILNIQPVIPFHINQDWNIITRTIVSARTLHLRAYRMIGL
jgi:hypothetical protein